jgi:glycosyltransferase involved in cell wall biosynthesis
MQRKDKLLSVIIPSFNNLSVLRRCLESWQRHASDKPVEILVIEDGCRDETAEYLREVAASAWGRHFLRWFHENDVGELKCNNRGFREATSPLLLVWQDDMFLHSGRLVDEVIATFASYADIGLLSLSRGLNCIPVDEPIETWNDLIDWRRLQSTIGEGRLNWFRLQEVDIVIRPWVVRRECLDRVGLMDEAFCPHEWDEADLCMRIRRENWKIATHGYERAGFYTHLGSTTISKKPPERQQALALKNGLLFHERWGDTLRAEHPRSRQTWLRRMGPIAWAATFRQMARFIAVSQRGLDSCEQDS